MRTPKNSALAVRSLRCPVDKQVDILRGQLGGKVRDGNGHLRVIYILMH